MSSSATEEKQQQLRPRNDTLSEAGSKRKHGSENQSAGLPKRQRSSTNRAVGTLLLRKTGYQLVESLFEGKIDVIGDVHGEAGALTTLLDRLGYDAAGNHAEGRKLVFVGDLVDRGPNSVACVDVVRTLIESGNAQMVLGNHEINLIRGLHKHGNSWFYNKPEVIRKDKKEVSFQVHEYNLRFFFYVFLLWVHFVLKSETESRLLRLLYLVLMLQFDCNNQVMPPSKEWTKNTIEFLSSQPLGAWCMRMAYALH